MNGCSAPLDCGYYPPRVGCKRRNEGEGRGAVNHEHDLPEASAELGKLLSRRQILQRATVLGLGGLVFSALPGGRPHPVVGRAVAGRREPRRRHAAGLRRHDDPGPQGRAAPTSATRSTRRRSPASHAEPGAVEADALLLYHHPLIGFDALEPAFLADAGDALAAARRPVPRPHLREPHRGHADAASPRPTRSRAGLGGRAGRPLHRVLRGGRRSRTRTIDTASGLPGDGPSRHRRRTATRTTPTGASCRRERTSTGSLP